uniref:Protein TIC 214 n=1 Tax=Selaginella lyallii TaxID=137159 RepID=A0A481ZKC8_9TRAC|nr:hypothetical chloroplast RF19 [Selaginella lyallii]QBL02063.1 hypothetical chloroplast RF19 [Selaginella lyallii]
MQKWVSPLRTPPVPVPGWASIPGSLILFGLYCGFVTTLPLGLSHVSLLRVAPILNKGIRGGSAVSGFVISQIIIILSVYYLHFYIMLVKPHGVTLLVFPYFLLCWYRLSRRSRLEKERALRVLRATTMGLRLGDTSSRTEAVTPGGIAFQACRNILSDLFPPPLFQYAAVLSPAPARLVEIITYQHSDKFLFIISSLCGWLGSFFFLEYLIDPLGAPGLLYSKGKDSLLGFRSRGQGDRVLIHRISGIIAIVFCFQHCGRNPLWVPPPRDKKSEQEPPAVALKFFSWLDTWPTSVFDYRKGVRPFRYVKNDSNSVSPVKEEISQYYFSAGMGSGGQKLFLSYLPSLSTLGSNLDRFVNTSSLEGTLPANTEDRLTPCDRRSTDEHEVTYPSGELTSRIEALRGPPVDVLDHEKGFCNNENSVLTLAKNYDPYLGQKLRGRIAKLKSTWIAVRRSNRWMSLVGYFSELTNPFRTRDQNQAKQSTGDSNSSDDLNPDLRKQSSNNSSSSNDLNPDLLKQSTNNSNSSDDLNPAGLQEQSTNNSGSSDDLNLDLLEQKQIFDDCDSWDDINRRDYPLYLYVIRKLLHICDAGQLKNTFKRKPRGISKLTNEIALGPLSDIRPVKFKNINLLVNNKTGTSKMQKRPMLQPDYRRNLVIGAMRARRRKTLVWELAQVRTSSIFSLRIIDGYADSLNSLPGMSAKSVITTPRPAGLEPEIGDFSRPRDTGNPETVRLAILKRWDFSAAHWVRGVLLVIQLHLRRSFTVPFFIILKNICYLAAFQTTEWNEDWDELKKEIYVNCNYYGLEMSTTEFPTHWQRDGVQIKIVNPFRFKHRWNFVSRLNSVDTIVSLNETAPGEKGEPAPSNGAGLYGHKSNISSEIEYAYLTVLGSETELPFGNKSVPTSSFWESFLRNARIKWGKSFGGMPRIVRGEFRGSGKGLDPYPEYRERLRVNITSKGSESGDAPSSRPGRRMIYSKNFQGGSNDDFSLQVLLRAYPLVVILDHSECMARMSTEELSFFLHRGGALFRDIKPLLDRDEEAAPYGLLDSESPGHGIRRRHLIRRKHLFRRGGALTNTPATRTLHKTNTRFIQIGIYLRVALLRNVRRLVLICRSLSIWSNIGAIRRFTRYVWEATSYAIPHLGREKDQPINDYEVDSFIIAKDLIRSSGLMGPCPSESTRGQNAQLIPQVYVFHRAWRLGAVSKCPRLPDSEWGLHLSIRRGAPSCTPGRREMFGQELRAPGLRDWNEWLRNLRRYDVLSPEIWCKIAPQRWNLVAEHLWEGNSGKGSPRKKGSGVSPGREAWCDDVENTLAHAAIRSGKVEKRRRSKLLLQSFLELVPNYINARVHTRSREAFIPKAKALRDIRQFKPLGNSSYRKTEGWVGERNDIHYELRLWFHLEILRQLQNTEMPAKGTAARSLRHVTCEPSICLSGNRSFRSRRSVSSAQKLSLSGNFIDRWDLGSIQILAKMLIIENNTDSLRALLNPESSYRHRGALRVARLESLYKDIMRDLILLFHYVCTTKMNEMFENTEHRVAGVADDCFLTCKMFSILLNFRNRFRTILNIIPHEEFAPHIRILYNRGNTLSYPSNIGDVLLPKRRAELRIWESLYEGWLESNRQGVNRDGLPLSEKGTEGSFGQQDRELLVHNNMENELRLIRSILWPDYRLEDFSHINRFLFDTNNGSRVATLRVCPYPSRTFASDPTWMEGQRRRSYWRGQ